MSPHFIAIHGDCCFDRLLNRSYTWTARVRCVTATEKVAWTRLQDAVNALGQERSTLLAKTGCTFFKITLYCEYTYFFYLAISSPFGLTSTWWGTLWFMSLKCTNRACPLLFSFSSRVYFCLYGPFSCISFHTFSRQLSVFSLRSSGLISSALLVLSTTYPFRKVSHSPDIIFCGWLGSI